MKKIVFFLSLMAATVLVSCNKDPKPEPTPAADPSQREVFLGTYSMDVTGPLHAFVNIVIYSDTFDYNMDEHDIPMEIVEVPNSTTDVWIVVAMGGQTDTIQAEVANGRLILEPSHYTFKILDLISEMNLDPTVLSMVEKYIDESVQLTVDLTHSKAEMSNGVLTCTTTVKSEAESATSNLLKVEGTLSEIARKDVK